MKAKKIQRFLCLIPIISLYGIVIYTYINLARYKASFKRWLLFVAVGVVTAFLLFCVNSHNLQENYPIADIFINHGIGIAGSLMLIELQLVAPYDKRNDTPLPKNIKEVIITLIIIFIIGVMSFTVVPFFFDAIDNYNKLAIVDTNGADDYSLVKISRDELVNSEECSIFFYGELKEGDSSLIDDYYLEECDYDKLNFDSGKFNGVAVVHATKVDKDTVKLDINVMLEKGNAEVAIIVDGQYYQNVEINQQSEIIIDNAQNKTILIKAAGESADIRIEVNRTY